MGVPVGGRGWLVCVVLLAGVDGLDARGDAGDGAGSRGRQGGGQGAADDAKERPRAEDLIDDAAPAKAEPAAEPAAAPAARPRRQRHAAGGGRPTGPPAGNEPALRGACEALGWFYTVSFLFISFLLVALMVMNLLTARRENVCPSTLVEGFEKHLDEKQYQEAYELAKGDDSFLGQVLAAGLSKLSAGLPAGRRGHAGGRRRREHEDRSSPELHGADRHDQSHGGAVRHGRRHGPLVQRDRPCGRHAASVRAGRRCRHRAVDHAGRIGHRHSRRGRFGIIKNRIDRRVLEVGIISEGLMSRFENVGPRKK